MSEIFDLCDEAVERLSDLNPLAATFLGVAGRDHRWPAMTPAWHHDLADLMRELVGRAEVLEPTTEHDRVARRVLIDRLTADIVEVDHRLYRTDLNNIDCGFHAIRDTFDQMAQATKDDWSRIVVRLETIHEPLSGYRSSLADGIPEGDTAARRQVLAVIEQGATIRGAESGFRELLTNFDHTGIDDMGFRERLTAAIDHACSCFGELTDWLREYYLPDARAIDGVGEERYTVLARRFLGTDIDLRATYAWGWDEIRALWERVEEVAGIIDPSRTVAEVIELLHTDPARAAAGADEFVAAMRARQELALRELDGTHFDVPDVIKTIDVKVAAAGGALAAYYNGPSEDFTRPGTVWYPIAGRRHLPYFEEITTAYHEGFPGHHLQVGFQLAMDDQISRFHSAAVWYEGAGEGWALYAERLMLELGYMEKPDYEMGWLGGQLLRACRIVIDIGSHLGLPIPDDAPFHPGEAWSFELAKELLVTTAMQSDDMADSEVTRYLGWPAQAIAYKVGERAILALRTELVDQGTMELRDFHRRVLEAGAVGLDLLRELVTA